MCRVNGVNCNSSTSDEESAQALLQTAAVVISRIRPTLFNLLVEFCAKQHEIPFVGEEEEGMPSNSTQPHSHLEPSDVSGLRTSSRGGKNSAAVRRTGATKGGHALVIHICGAPFKFERLNSIHRRVEPERDLNHKKPSQVLKTGLIRGAKVGR